MPDLSDKVSDVQRFNELPQEVRDEIGRLLAVIGDPSVPEDTSIDAIINYAQSVVALRTRPPASSMEGWRTMDSAPENEWLDVWSENFGLARAHLSGQWGYAWMERPDVAVPGPPTYWRPLPIPPEVMK